MEALIQAGLDCIVIRWAWANYNIHDMSIINIEIKILSSFFVSQPCHILQYMRIFLYCRSGTYIFGCRPGNRTTANETQVRVLQFFVSGMQRFSFECGVGGLYRALLFENRASMCLFSCNLFGMDGWGTSRFLFNGLIFHSLFFDKSIYIPSFVCSIRLVFSKHCTLLAGELSATHIASFP